MKRIFVSGLIVFTLIMLGFSAFDQDFSWAARQYQYIGHTHSTTTKLFTLDGSATTVLDTTAAFRLRENMIFWVNAQQAGDSIGFKVTMRLLPANYADSTTYWVTYDSSFVNGTTGPGGARLLKWTNFKTNTDSIVPALPPAQYMQFIISADSTVIHHVNGQNTSINIRYEAQGDW